MADRRARPSRWPLRRARTAAGAPDAQEQGGAAPVVAVVPPSCELVVESLSARLDGEAAPLPRATVERHVASCRRCARVAVGLPVLAKLVAPAAAERPDPPRRWWSLRAHRPAR